MIRMSAEERNSILTGLKVELKSLLGKYQSDKYPEEEHQRLLAAFAAPKSIGSEVIKTGLCWKYGHLRKSNFPQSHKNLIEKVQRCWPNFITYLRESGNSRPERIFRFWNQTLDGHQRFITVCFLLHLLHPDEQPIIDQHSFRAMNFLLQAARPGWRSKKIPSDYEDLANYREFFLDLRQHWQSNGMAPGARELDQVLMMFGKHRTGRKRKSRQTNKSLERMPAQKRRAPLSSQPLGHPGKGGRVPSFNQVYQLLQVKGPGRAVSSRGTEYRVEAKDGSILAFPRKGRVTIYRDCWGESITCQGTRAGGVYNGPYSIYDWYRDNLKEG